MNCYESTVLNANFLPSLTLLYSIESSSHNNNMANSVFSDLARPASRPLSSDLRIGQKAKPLQSRSVMTVFEHFQQTCFPVVYGALNAALNMAVSSPFLTSKQFAKRATRSLALETWIGK